MIVIEKVLPKKDYICSFCGSGLAKMIIVYIDPKREARVPMCQVCYEELGQACAKSDYYELTEKMTAPAPKKTTRKTKKSE